MDDLEVENYFSANIELLSRKYTEYHIFAFWHDVMVTALSAFATALLTIKKESAGYEFIASIIPFITLILPFLTGLVTVFVACDHFFKFRSNADKYEEALHSLIGFQTELRECNWDKKEAKSTKGRTKLTIYKDATDVMAKAKVLPNIDDRVFRWPCCRKENK